LSYQSAFMCITYCVFRIPSLRSHTTQHAIRKRILWLNATWYQRLRWRGHRQKTLRVRKTCSPSFSKENPNEHPQKHPQTVADVPILQWASGHTQARSAPSGRFAPHIGFHSEQGKDAVLDAAAQAAGIPPIEICHPRPGGSEIKPHWSFGERVRFHPITAGPPAVTISGCLRLAEQTAAAGLGLLWQPGEKSRLAVRGLVIIGEAPILVQLSVRSTMTGFLLASLIDHYRVCDTADRIIVLLAVMHLGANAYGVTIRQTVAEATGQEPSIGAIYTALDRLEQKGFVSSHQGEPTPERGGRAKRYFKIEGAGVQALNEAERVRSLLDDHFACLRDERAVIRLPRPVAVEGRQRVQPPADRLHHRRQVDRLDERAARLDSQGRAQGEA
jgi:PadR family transcriptional regulator PadR